MHLRIHSFIFISGNSLTILYFFRDYVSDNLQAAANQEALGITILIVVLAVSPVIIWLVHNAVATIQVSTSSEARSLHH